MNYSDLPILDSERRPRKPPITRGPNRRKERGLRTSSGLVLPGMADGSGSIQWTSGFEVEQLIPPTTLQSEQSLFLAILEDAVDLVLKMSGPQSKRSKRMKAEALEWILSDDIGFWTVSFVRVCEVLHLEVEWVRAGVVKKMQEAA